MMIVVDWILLLQTGRRRAITGKEARRNGQWLCSLLIIVMLLIGVSRRMRLRWQCPLIPSLCLIAPMLYSA